MSSLKRIVRVALLGAALQSPAASAATLISEVFYDAVGADNGYSFVELYGTPGASLAGLSLQGINGANGQAYVTLALSGAFNANGVFVVADNVSGTVTHVPNADLVLNFDWQNGPDSVLLKAGGKLIDALAYGVFGPGTFFAGEGAAAPATMAGQSLARRSADRDTDNNAADFIVLVTPTPGQLMLAPLPGTSWLLLSGLLGTIVCGRRRVCRGGARA